MFIPKEFVEQMVDIQLNRSTYPIGFTLLKHHMFLQLQAQYADTGALHPPEKSMPRWQENTFEWSSDRFG